MRRRIFTMWVLLCAVGASTSVGSADDTKVTFALRGLFAVDTRDGQVVFLNPGGTHPPRLMIDQEQLDPQPTLTPELVIPKPDGSGTSIWRFYK